ncbi:MAG TPA: hypothetical protein VN639_18715 [Azonexus sp.]|nr:hypothetical protein [Azonexus sp.]
MRRWLAAVLVVLAGNAPADETVSLCYGYGCLSFAEVRYTELHLATAAHLLIAAVDAGEEREILGRVIGDMYGWAGQQSDIHNDRGGNLADGNLPGKMDCIDHATSTTRLLRVLESRGILRFHRVLEPDVRYWGYVFPAHYSAVIEEKTAGGAQRFVVDSWFVDNGEPAVILPLDDWKKGAGPDV